MRTRHEPLNPAPPKSLPDATPRSLDCESLHHDAGRGTDVDDRQAGYYRVMPDSLAPPRYVIPDLDDGIATSSWQTPNTTITSLARAVHRALDALPFSTANAADARLRGGRTHASNGRREPHNSASQSDDRNTSSFPVMPGQAAASPHRRLIDVHVLDGSLD